MTFHGLLKKLFLHGQLTRHFSRWLTTAWNKNICKSFTSSQKQWIYDTCTCSKCLWTCFVFLELSLFTLTNMPSLEKVTAWTLPLWPFNTVTLSLPTGLDRVHNLTVKSHDPVAWKRNKNRICLKVNLTSAAFRSQVNKLFFFYYKWTTVWLYNLFFIINTKIN